MGSETSGFDTVKMQSPGLWTDTVSVESLGVPTRHGASRKPGGVGSNTVSVENLGFRIRHGEIDQVVGCSDPYGEIYQQSHGRVRSSSFTQRRRPGYSAVHAAWG